MRVIAISSETSFQSQVVDPLSLILSLKSEIRELSNRKTHSHLVEFDEGTAR